jgi:hypothetical protein
MALAWLGLGQGTGFRSSAADRSTRVECLRIVMMHGGENIETKSVYRQQSQIAERKTVLRM